MAFTEDQKKFMLEAYFRNGTKNDGVWQYSIGACYEEFREEFPQEVFDYEKFRQTLHRCLNNWQEAGSIGRKKGSGRPKLRTPEVVENVQNIIGAASRTSIRQLAQQTGL
ncbi:hypothetical protein BDFB_011794, partial [Asbolus verrucosus]